jgi:hypothetical protein
MVTKSNVTYLNRNPGICLEKRFRDTNPIVPEISLKLEARSPILSVRGRVDVSAHHAHLIILLVQVVEQNVPQ